jgi:predicted RNA-binding Zn-ribbon protein involved in translation (DUF1610 family)
MDYKLLLCENCENVISVSNIENKVFICPACGTINERNRSNNYIGRLVIESPIVSCQLDDTDGIIKLKDDNEELITALFTLAKFGWSIKFKGIKNDEPLS